MGSRHEKYILDNFRELFINFPEGDVIPSEMPDFLVKSDIKTTGIELTHIFNDIHIDGKNNEKRRENIRRMVGDSLCEKLKLIIPYTFILSINFSRKEFVTNDISRIVSESIQSLCEFHFVTSAIASVNFENIGQLPNEIDQINVQRYDKMDSSFYSESAGGAIPNLTELHLAGVLSKKEQALKSYQYCDEYWLLIESDSFYSDAFNEIKLGRIETSFDRVFIYRHNKREVTTLK